MSARPVTKPPQRPLDPDLVRLVEALADANALRDHRAAVAAREAAGKAKGQANAT